jgi:hypothetical protein
LVAPHYRPAVNEGNGPTVSAQSQAGCGRRESITDVRPDVREANLSGAHLSEPNLRGPSGKPNSRRTAMGRTLGSARRSPTGRTLGSGKRTSKGRICDIIDTHYFFQGDVDPRSLHEPVPGPPRHAAIACRIRWPRLPSRPRVQPCEYHNAASSESQRATGSCNAATG